MPEPRLDQVAQAVARFKPSPARLGLKMPKVSREALREIELALKLYEAEVGGTKLTSPTKKTYLGHSRHFVRWLKDDFTPGERTG
jgi:hypothetical protein